MDPQEARRRFSGARVARLATVRPDGSPHLVPVTFAIAGDTIWTVVDAKPKSTERLQRLENLRHEPRCALLADQYDDDWSRLWWVRADARATVVEAPPPDHAGLRHLAERYPTYRTDPPTGALIELRVQQWRGWAAS
jgi:PPOX class probable F420-dependent enzyme